MKNRTKRSAVAMVAVLSVMALLLVSFTLAYLTDSRSTLNILGIGTGEGPGPGDRNTVQIALTEAGFAAEADSKVDFANGIAGEYTEVKMLNIVPGQTINKDPKITNTGADGVYVRVRFVDEDGDLVNLSTGIFDLLGVQVSNQFKYNTLDGYWYYTAGTATHAVLAVDAAVDVFVNQGTATTPYTMKLDPSLNNDDLANLLGLVNLEVVAEAIQSKAFEPGAIDSATPWADDDGVAVPAIPAIRG